MRKKITQYGARTMAGNCVNSAQEVGAALAAQHGPDAVRYVAIVYGDDSGAARNHIAAALVTPQTELVVDATWKQFPYLRDRIVEVEREPWLRTFSREDWLKMVTEYTPGMRDVVFTTETTLDEARQWMKEQFKNVPTFAPVTSKPKGSRGCTLF